MKYYCACVDVDNTLFDFAGALHELFKADGVLMHPPEQWDKWDYFYPEYMTKSVAYEYFNKVHSQQRQYNPFVDAKKFLEKLDEERSIVIASHRHNDQRAELVKWLDEHNLPYSEVWVGQDKTTLFNRHIFDVVVDDAPAILEAAHHERIPCYGLKRAWNVNCQYGVLCKSLTEIGHRGGWM